MMRTAHQSTKLSIAKEVMPAKREIKLNYAQTRGQNKKNDYRMWITVVNFNE